MKILFFCDMVLEQCGRVPLQFVYMTRTLKNGADYYKKQTIGYQMLNVKAREQPSPFSVETDPT